jgi:hypothetical protein
MVFPMRKGFWVLGSGFRVQGSGFRVQRFRGSKVQRFKVLGSRFKVQGSEVQGSGFRVQSSRFRGSRFRVQSSRFWVLHRRSPEELLVILKKKLHRSILLFKIVGAVFNRDLLGLADTL